MKRILLWLPEVGAKVDRHLIIMALEAGGTILLIILKDDSTQEVRNILIQVLKVSQDSIVQVTVLILEVKVVGDTTKKVSDTIIQVLEVILLGMKVKFFREQKLKLAIEMQAYMVQVIILILEVKVLQDTTKKICDTLLLEVILFGMKFESQKQKLRLAIEMQALELNSNLVSGRQNLDGEFLVRWKGLA